MATPQGGCVGALELQPGRSWVHGDGDNISVARPSSDALRELQFFVQYRLTKDLYYLYPFRIKALLCSQ